MPLEMVIKVDKQGRVVIPKDIREKYHFTQDEEIIISEQPTGIFLSRKKAQKSLKEIFNSASTANLDKVLALDITNLDEEEF